MIHNCFLCHPEPDLVGWEDATLRLIAGLGPVVPNYCVIGLARHVPSFADARLSDTGIVEQTVGLRQKIEGQLGATIITEHGRVPICADATSVHEAHCYHGHLLVFPTKIDILDLAATYYRQGKHFDNAEDAWKYAATTDEYFLVSPSKETFAVYSGELNTPRQLARHLVASRTISRQEVDWRRNPQRDVCAETARFFRGALGSLP